mgnify:FL=1
MNPIINFISKVFRLDRKDRMKTRFHNLLEEYVEHGFIATEEQRMVKAILKLNQKDVEEVMVPRTDMVSVPADMEVDRVLQLAVECGFSRYPVYHKSIDNLVGVVYLKDLNRFRRYPDTPVIEAVRLPYFVPRTYSVLQALRDMRRRHVSLAIVTDEYGTVEGLVTIKDLVEEIVGELSDEFEKVSPEIQKVGENRYIVNAAVDLDKLNEILGLNLHAKDVNTFGGYIIKTIGYIPRVGEHLNIAGLRVEILQGSQRRIKSVLVEKLHDT